MRKERKGKERKGKERKGKERKGKERKGKERKGKERKGKERKGKERKGKERKGKERKGKERKGKERKGRLWSVQGPGSSWRPAEPVQAISQQSHGAGSAVRPCHAAKRGHSRLAVSHGQPLSQLIHCNVLLTWLVHSSRFDHVKVSKCCVCLADTPVSRVQTASWHAFD